MMTHIRIIPPMVLLLALVGTPAMAQDQDKRAGKTIEWSWEQDEAKDKSKELGAALRKEVKKVQALLDLEKMEAEVEELLDLTRAERKAVRSLLEDFRKGWIREDGRGITIDSSKIDERFERIAQEAEEELGSEKADLFIDWLDSRQDAAETRLEFIEQAATNLTKGLTEWAEVYGKDFAEKSKDIEKWAKDFGKEWEKWGEQFGEDYGKNWEKWGKQFGRDMEKWGEHLGKDLEKWGEQYGKDWEKWGEQFGRDWEHFGKDWEKWGERFGKDWEKWGKDLGRKLEGLEGKSAEEIEEKISGLLTEDLQERIQDSITDTLQQSLQQLEHIKDLNLDGLEERIQQAVQKSLSGIETMELSEKVLRENLEKAGQNIFEATGQLQKLLDMKRDDWDLQSKEQWKVLEKALKEMEINLPKLEGLEIEGMKKETLDDLLKQRIEKIKKEKSKAMSSREDAYRAQAEIRDAERAEAIEKLKLEQDAIKLRDKDLQKLKKEIEALKQQLKELKKENRNLERELDSDREREANRRFLM